MEEEIIKDYLKNHLKLSIKEKVKYDYSYDGYKTFHVRLLLDDEIISEDIFEFRD